MLPFGAIVMAHIPLSKQSVGTPHAELAYAVGTSPFLLQSYYSDYTIVLINQFEIAVKLRGCA